MEGAGVEGGGTEGAAPPALAGEGASAAGVLGVLGVPEAGVRGAEPGVLPGAAVPGAPPEPEGSAGSSSATTTAPGTAPSEPSAAAARVAWPSSPKEAVSTDGRVGDAQPPASPPITEQNKKRLRCTRIRIVPRTPIPYRCDRSKRSPLVDECLEGAAVETEKNLASKVNHRDTAG